MKRTARTSGCVSAAIACAAVAVVLTAPRPAPAQQADTVEASADSAGATSSADTAMYRREVFDYPEQGRRDPFGPLQSFASSGPRLDQLTLSGILYGGEGGGSIVVLVDPSTGARYRLRVGDSVGFARLARVEPRRAIFSVTGFGRDRNVVLRLKQDEESSQ